MEEYLNVSSQRSLTEEVDDLLDQITRVPQKRFKCEICLKSFASKHCLTEHQYSHTGEKPYLCQFCQKRFKFASQFSTHKKSHRVGEELNWCKLTDLLRNRKGNYENPQITGEIVELPQITAPQNIELPPLISINNRVH